MAANRPGPAARHPSAEALACYEELRERLYRLSEGRPAYPHLRAAAVATYCHWRALAHPAPEPGVAPAVVGIAE